MQLLKGNQSTMAYVSRLLLLLTLAHSTSVTVAEYDHTCNVLSRPHRNGRCGRLLVDTVNLLCNSFSGLLVKRDTTERVNENIKHILLNKKEALSYLTKREARGSIVCECCYHTCTISELLKYCSYDVYNSKHATAYRSSHQGQ
ncbi:molluscan insulin-related peptide 3 [Biomphalaria pfeifferi]|uniref:Molluscan insulin-related peptide 3 n=1 Tax=Biomphalaria pfeifferi TaxID=112525 RepID=A0AAD8BFP1_BIOPF|nr:molluscan insulin-related peptide 3 [Biomphalaria pfeifferi]